MKNLNSKNLLKITATLAIFLTFAAAEEDSAVVYKPLQFGGVQEFGSIVRGAVANEVGKLTSTDPKAQLHNEWVDHFGTFVEQDVLVDRRLELKVGLGGVFEFPKPEYVISTYGSSMYKLFFFGPSVAKAMYAFGNPDAPVLSLGGGLFPYKYNSDAADLGEYLFRSGPYPTYIMTGGVTFINDNSAYLQGFQANLHLGNLKVDALLTTETSLPPLYDLSLAVVGDYSIADGLVDVGAGVNFKRMIPINPDRTQRKTNPDGSIAWQNVYFTRNGKQYYGDAEYYRAQKNFYTRIHDSVSATQYQSIADSIVVWEDSTKSGYVGAGDRNYYTPAGTIFMARASLDLKKIIPVEMGAAPVKLFVEAAVLGWKEYPIFYEDRWKRAPIMLGAHLPTFGLLDQLTVQFEYFNSPWSNNTYNLGSKNMAIPNFPDGLEPMFSTTTYNDAADDDNLAWAVLLRRQIYPHLNLSAQLARDHLRTIGTNWFYGGRLEPSEVLFENSQWYWMVQLGWAL